MDNITKKTMKDYEIMMPELELKLNSGIILGKPIPQDKTPGGIIIPEDARREQVPRLVIVKVADDVKLVKRGDVVVYTPMSQPLVLVVEGHKLLKVYPDEILGIEPKPYQDEAPSIG